MAESYSVLGGFFEYLNADCDYAEWSQYLLNKIEKAGCGKRGLDIGCGNGYFTRAFNKAGYIVDGMDISPEMLSVAKTLALKEGVRREFLLGDICKLKLCAKVDFCTAVNDCINYVPPQKLKTAFSHVYNNLTKDGAFFFDISSQKKIREVLGNNVFAEERDDISYIWFNTQTENGVKMDLTFFLKRPDGLYERAEETHIQFAHSEEDVICALKEVGFSRVESESHPCSPKGERIQFCAYKR